MNLPTPTLEEVKEFAALYEREFGVVLSAEEAWEAATRTLRLFCLGTYGLKTMAPDLSPQREVPPQGSSSSSAAKSHHR